MLVSRFCIAFSLLLPISVSAFEPSPNLSASLRDREIVVELDLPPSTYTYIASPYALPLALEFDEADRALLGEGILPSGIQKDDELIARGSFALRVPLLAATRPEQIARIQFSLRIQLCDEENGQCFPPRRYLLGLAENGGRGVLESGEKQGASSASPASSIGESLAEWLRGQNKNLPLALLLAFCGGLLASLTPCVYPVIPVVLAFFAREGAAYPGGRADDDAPGPAHPEPGSAPRWRRLRLAAGALAYILGISLVYTSLGLAAGLIGGAFGSFVSTPPFFLAVSLIFYILALSLLDAVEFRLPRLGLQSAGIQGGRAGTAKRPLPLKRNRAGTCAPSRALLRAFGMGMITGLVASPCVGPVVFFILTEIAQKGEAGYGALLMFAFSLGLGVLFFVFALFGKALSRLARAGSWMVFVKIALAALVFASSLYFVRQGLAALAPDLFVTLIQGLLVLLAGILAWRHFAKEFGRLSVYAPAAAGALLLVYAFILFSPRSSLAWGDELGAALEEARVRGRRVFIALGAGWCAACHELEGELIKNEGLRRFIEAEALPLRMDYDKNEDRFVRDYGVRALPYLLLLDENGRAVWEKGGFASGSLLPGGRLASELSNALWQGRGTKKGGHPPALESVH